MAERLPGNFRFVDRQKTLAVAGERVFENEATVNKLRAENFHVLGLTLKAERGAADAKVPCTFKGKEVNSIWESGQERGFYEMIDEITRHHDAGKKVLVTCGAGISTSPTVAAAYLVLKRGYQLEEAVEAVTKQKYAREIVRNYLRKFAANEPERWMVQHAPAGSGLLSRLRNINWRFWRK